MFFTVGTIVCCLSQDFTALLAGRAIQGVGGGGILSLNNIILTDIIPLRQRPLFISLIGIFWSLGSIGAPTLEACWQSTPIGVGSFTSIFHFAPLVCCLCPSVLR